MNFKGKYGGVGWGGVQFVRLLSSVALYTIKFSINIDFLKKSIYCICRS